MTYGFDIALAALKSGDAIARSGWNGKGMWLILVQSYEWDIACNVLDTGTSNTNELELLPWIGMKTSNNCFVPWLASQTDLLANDWVLVDLSKV